LAADIEFHFECGHDISAAFPCIQAICDHVLTHYARFGVNVEIYGDLRPQYERLRQKIGEPCAAPNGGPATQRGNSGVMEGPPS
jgi:hypothetical protein